MLSKNSSINPRDAYWTLLRISAVFQQNIIDAVQIYPINFQIKFPNLHGFFKTSFKVPHQSILKQLWWAPIIMNEKDNFFQGLCPKFFNKFCRTLFRNSIFCTVILDKMHRHSKEKFHRKLRSFIRNKSSQKFVKAYTLSWARLIKTSVNYAKKSNEITWPNGSRNFLQWALFESTLSLNCVLQSMICYFLDRICFWIEISHAWW